MRPADSGGRGSGARPGAWTGSGRRGSGRGRAAARVGFGLAGLAGAAALVAHVGPDRLWATLVPALAWTPLALVFEGSRILVEAEATRALYRPVIGPVGRGPLLRAQLVAYSAFVLIPAGRAASEAVKATLLAPRLGSTNAAAIAALAQGVALVGTAVASIGCALAAHLREGAWELATAIWLHTLAVATLGGVVLFALRRRAVGRLASRLLRWMRFAEDERESFLDVIRSVPPIPWAALAGFVAARALSVLVFLVWLMATGSSPSVLAALRAMGVSLMGSAALDMVPADLGLTEGAFTLFADDVPVTLAQGVAIGLLFHFTQISWVLVSALAALVWRPPSDGGEAATLDA